MGTTAHRSLLSDVHGSALDVLALHVDLQPVQVDDAVLDGGGHVAAVCEPHLLHHVATTCLEYPAHLNIRLFADQTRKIIHFLKLSKEYRYN